MATDPPDRVDEDATIAAIIRFAAIAWFVLGVFAIADGLEAHHAAGLVLGALFIAAAGFFRRFRRSGR